MFIILYDENYLSFKYIKSKAKTKISNIVMIKL